jgi:formylglycine-generating enzyme required for sulfatase activity
MSTSDAFLSHNSADKPQVEAIGRHLEARGVTCWLDKWNLIPGAEWQEEIEAELRRCACCVVFVGAEGIRKESWQHEEMRRAIARRVEAKDEKFRVIPVLLPGADRGKRSELPDFLTRATWVEFGRSVDEPEPLDRLVAGIRGVPPRSHATAAAFGGRCPYQGLDAFQKEDADLYFGREADVEWLIQHLKSARFLGIVGASGSGKSSLARAGLVPALEKGVLPGSAHWPVILLRPGARPLESLATALGRRGLTASAGTLEEEMKTRDNRLHLAVRQGIDEEREPDRRVVILVDQFEEVFTVCDDETQRAGFIANLLYAAQVSGGRTVVVLTMRADFYPQCAAYGQLAVTMSDHQLLVGPMDRENLRQVIERPAALTGCELEPGLVEMLLDDMDQQPPGALPLLQHCLKQLWERRKDGRILTVAAYKGPEIGGIAGALEKHADRIFDGLTPREQEACAALFTKLVRPGEGSADTKRIAALAKAAPEPVSQKLVQVMSAPEARLLTTDADGVEITHEALIRSWGKLRQWVERDRKWILVEQRLSEDAEAWKDQGRKAKFLYSGARLEDAKVWRRRKRKAREAQHFPLEMQFVGRSIGRANLRTRLMGTLTIAALGFGGLAIWGMEKSLQARDDARAVDGYAALGNAKAAPKRYPDQLLHRARAIGFSGFGGEDHVKRDFITFWIEAYRLLSGKEDPFPVLIPEEAVAIRKELASQPAYLPFWRSAASGSPVTGLVFAENDRYLLAKTADNTVRRWDLRNPEAPPETVTTEVPDSPETTGVRFQGGVVTFHAFGKQAELAGHSADATAWCLNTETDRLVIGLADGSVVAWDVSGRPLGDGADLLAFVERGWVDFNEARDVVPGALRDAQMLAALWNEAAPPSFDPAVAAPFRNSLGMHLLPVEPGTFFMGSPETEEERSDDEVRHEVKLTQRFWLGQYEVTQAEWTALMGGNPSDRKDPLAPVENVSWEDVDAFCKKLTEQERKTGRLPEDWIYALPTEGQWEYACRAGTTTPFSFGKVLDGSQANCDGTSPYGTTVNGPYLSQTVAVGRYPANPWEFHDMHGNVCEWCRDWYGEYEFKEGEATPDPIGRASGDARVNRGGCWRSLAGGCRSALRGGGTPDFRYDLLGFRLAAVPSSLQPEANQRTE